MNKCILLGIGYSVLIFSLMMAQSQAVMIEAIAKDSKAVHKEEKLNFYPRKLTIQFKPQSGSSFDPKCLTVKGQMGLYAGSSGKIKIAGWGAHSLNYNTIGKYGYDLTITNQCGLPIKGYLEGQFSRTNPTTKGKLNRNYIEIDSQKCSVNVNNVPVIPDIFPNETNSLIKITSNISGDGMLSFIPSERNGEKGVLRNDNNNQISYSMATIPWNNKLLGWSGKLDEYSLNIDKISSATQAGIYKGTMTVRISCN